MSKEGFTAEVAMKKEGGAGEIRPAKDASNNFTATAGPAHGLQAERCLLT